MSPGTDGAPGLRLELVRDGALAGTAYIGLPDDLPGTLVAAGQAGLDLLAEALSMAAHHLAAYADTLEPDETGPGPLALTEDPGQ